MGKGSFGIVVKLWNRPSLGFLQADHKSMSTSLSEAEFFLSEDEAWAAADEAAENSKHLVVGELAPFHITKASFMECSRKERI